MWAAIVQPHRGIGTYVLLVLPSVCDTHVYTCELCEECFLQCTL